MGKTIYTLQIEREKLDANQIVSELPLIMDDISKNVSVHHNNFDFEINLFIDGYLQSEDINKAFTYIFRDIYYDDGLLNDIRINGKELSFVNAMIVMFFEKIALNPTLIEAEVGTNIKEDGSSVWEGFILARSILNPNAKQLSDSHISNILAFIPQTKYIEIFIVPKMYHKLARVGCIDSKDNRDYRNYEIDIYW